MLAATPAGVGPNLRVSPADTNVYSTTTAALDPANDGNLYASSNILTAAPVAAFASQDAGNSWAAAPLPLPAAAPNQFAADPSAAYDGSGALWETYLGFAVSGSLVATQLVAAESLNHGHNWTGTPIVVEPASATPDKPLLAIDRSGGAYQNRLYVAYDTNPNGRSQPIVVARSDGGSSWSRSTVYDSGGDFGATPAVDASGRLFVAWHDYCGAPDPLSACPFPQSGPGGRMLISRSNDGGASFTGLGATPVTVATTAIGFGTTMPNYSNNCSGSGAQQLLGIPALAVDRSVGNFAGNLYLAWADYPLGKMHIYFSRSTNGGGSWSSPVQVDLGNQNDGWGPALAVDQATGTVVLSWYDRRDDPANKLYRAYLAESIDGGASFLPGAVPVASSQSDPTLDCAGTGDYTEMIADNGVAHPFWPDTRNGRNQIFTAAVDEAAVAQAHLPPVPAFGPTANSGTLSSPYRVIAADVNGDGKLDLVVNNGGSYISVLPGNGDGTFQPAKVTQPIPGGVTDFAVGDINGDGKPDLVVSGSQQQQGYSSGAVSILYGNGDGTFGVPFTMASGGAATGQIALADLDSNGTLDIAVANPGGTTSVSAILQNADHTFQPAKITPAPGVNAIAIGDLNGDGKPDLVVADRFNGVVLVFPGNGDGTFGTAVSTLAGSGPQALALADVNGDSKLDVVVANAYYAAFNVLLGKGDGTLQPAAAYGSGGYGASALATGNFMGQGKVDVALPDGLGTVGVWAGSGDGSFRFDGDFPAHSTPYGIASGDFNRDHRADLAVTNTGSNDLSILLGQGPPAASLSAPSLDFGSVQSRTASAPKTVTLTNTGSAPLHPALIDLTGPNASAFIKTSDSCSGAAIAAGQSCTVGVRYLAPRAGGQSAWLTITDDALDSAQHVGLIGIATLVPPPPTPAIWFRPRGSAAIGVSSMVLSWRIGRAR